MNIELLYGFRGLKKISSIEAQQKIQMDYLSKSYRKYLVKTYDINIFSKYLYLAELWRLFLTATMKMIHQDGNNEIIMMASSQNQKRQIEYLQNDILSGQTYRTYYLLGNQRCDFKNIWFIKDTVKAIPTLIRYYNQSYQSENAIDLKNNILFLCSYILATQLLKQDTTKAIIVANDHSSIPLGFAAAARSLDKKVIYIQHAHVTTDMPSLRADLAILDGQSAFDIYTENGTSKRTDIVYRGLEGEERSMNCKALLTNDDLTVGVFVNVFKDDDLILALQNIADHPRVKRVRLRGHPAFPIKINVAQLPSNVSISSSDLSLLDDARICDVVIGGNSSLHLSVLKFGIPCIFYDALDYINYDDYSFVKQNILYETKNLSNIDFSAVGNYYNESQWKRNFSYFDAAYEKKDEQFNKNIKKSMLKILSA